MLRGRWMAALVISMLAASTAAIAGSQWDGNPTTSTLGFTPVFRVDAGSLVDRQYDLTLRVEQNTDEDVASKYAVHIPAGFRFSIGSVKPSVYTSCADMVPDLEASPGTINTKAEAVGVANLGISTQSSNNATIYMLGQSYFLKYTPSTPDTGTATFCGFVGTTNAAIAGDATNTNNRRILFQMDLTLNADKSWDAAYSLKSVPGLAPGTHSIIDNVYFQGNNTTIRSLNIELRGLTYGNYNTDPNGVKEKVPFAYTPAVSGTYNFIGTISPCGSDLTDPAQCASSASPVTIGYPVGISASTTPVHGIPVLTSPARFSGIGTQPFAKPIIGKSTVDVKWNQVSATPFDSIKGYLVTTGVPYQPDLIHFDYYVTNPAASGYNAALTNPCGADGAATSCGVTLQFPMATTDGRTMPVNGIYSTSVVAIYLDGHRSDGRCDDGTAAGFAPPCADGSIPQFAEPGFTSVNYLIRSKAWPLAYSQVISRQVGDSSDRDRVRVDQIFLLFVDLDQHTAEFVIWQPYGLSYPMSATTILGSNAAGAGVIAVLDNTNTQGKRFGLQALINPVTGVRGRYEIFANNLVIASHAEIVMSKL